MECAAEADGIRVYTVHPGVIDTPIWTKLSGSGGRNVPIDPNEVAKAGVPLGRAGQAQDIANGVLFLASDASQLHDGRGTGDRRRHDGRRTTSMELNDSLALGFGGIANCEFSGKSHSKYIYGRFR